MPSESSADRCAKSQIAAITAKTAQTLTRLSATISGIITRMTMYIGRMSK